jgi:acyl carrier protein
MIDPVAQKISAYIADNILFSHNGYPHPLDASFLENGIVDSMNILELVMYVEECFGVKVADNDIVPENFDSVTRMANYVLSKQNGSHLK